MSAPLARRLEDLGIVTPLPIQAATIPDALSGRDIYGQAPTGSGKTLAFGLPLVMKATGSKPGLPRALVLVPTRELAEQVKTYLASLMGSRSKRVVALYGGTSYGPQRQALRRGADIVVACPGRLEDLVERRDVNLSEVRTVVLDEADRMVDMGFIRPVCRLVDQTSQERQVLLFSATMGNGWRRSAGGTSVTRRATRSMPSHHRPTSRITFGACHARSGEAHRRADRTPRESLRVLPDQARG